MARKSIWAIVPLALVLCVASAAAKDQLTTQDPASAQPTLPKPMPNLNVSIPGSSEGAPKKHRNHISTHHGARHHHYARRYTEPVERPALANVVLTEALPHPPQPPHVTVPVPGYPLDNFVTYFTAPPPPVVCRPTRHDRFKPDLGLVDETPVLCTADNP